MWRRSMSDWRKKKNDKEGELRVLGEVGWAEEEKKRKKNFVQRKKKEEEKKGNREEKKQKKKTEEKKRGRKETKTKTEGPEFMDS